MIPYLVDHCFDEDVLRAVMRRSPVLDFVLARDVGLAEAQNPNVLAWAAREGQVVMTHDRNTMVGFAVERIRAGEAMAGLVVVSQFAPLATRIAETSALPVASWKPERCRRGRRRSQGLARRRWRAGFAHAG